jgi:methanogenic corrinoid protein MtbC1
LLKWCSYCQRFMGETPPHDDFGITHGLCGDCETSRIDLFSKREIERAVFLSDIFHRLFDAGRREDIAAAQVVVGKAIAEQCRPVDILIGMIAPMLYEIGEEWKRGALSVAGEHRFTAFCERVIALVEARHKATHADANGADASASRPLLFLMNARGNMHTLAVRILALWLASQGARVRIVDSEAGVDALLRDIAAEFPKSLLISVSLREQRAHVAEIVRCVSTLPAEMRPKVIVGGYAVKAGLMRSLRGAELVADISKLRIA